MDLEKVQNALAGINEENQQRQAAEEAEANKTTWDRVVEAGGAAVNWVENTASDVAGAYNKLGEARQTFLDRGAQIQQAYSQGSVDTANDSGDYSQQEQSVSDLQAAGSEAVTATRNFALSPIRETAREFVNAYADDDDSSVQSLAQSVRQSDASLTYFMTDQEKLAKARDIEAETGIPTDSIINDTKAYKEALEIYDFKKKKEAAGGDINQVWNEFPELKDIASMSPQDAALALHNIESVRSTHGIVETFTHMLESGNRILEWKNLQCKIMTGTADDNDRQRADDLKEQINADQKKIPSFWDDPAAAIAGGIAQSAPGMWQSITEGVRDGAIFAAAAMPAGAAAGSAAGGVGAVPGAALGAAGGFATGMARSLLARATTRELASAALGAGFRTGMFNGMAMPEIGSRFADYKDMKDENGDQLLTDNQARGYAALAGYANAGIEMANFGVVTKALKGTPHASKVFGDIIEQTGARLTAREAAKDAILSRAADTFKVAASETAEEGLQSISDDLVHNRMEADTGDTTNKVYSWKDIAGHAFVSMAEALPASLGFGVMSGLGGVVPGGIRVSQAMRHTAEFDAKYGEAARQTMTGTIMLEQLQQAVSDGKMKDTAPDVQRRILKTQLDGTGYENAYIDTEMAMKKENGMDDLKAVAKAADISGEDLQTAIEEKGHIMVPVERFSQASTTPDLLDSVSFSPDADSLARMKDNATSTLKEVQERQQATIERQQKLIDNVVDEYYPSGDIDEDTRDMVKAAVFTNPSNPAQGWNALRADRKAQLDELIAPAMARLQDGMGKGGQIMETEDENGNKKYNRFTENDEWYQNFHKAFKRAPNQQELEDMAVAVTVGDPSAPKVPGFVPTPPEEQAAMEQAKPAIDQLRADIAKLDRIKPQMKKLTGVEMELTEGLSKEGFKTYRTIMDQLQQVGGLPARAARIDAILFARHADIYADIVTKKTGKKYTALDYMQERYGLDTTGEYADKSGALKQPIREGIDIEKKIPVLKSATLSNELSDSDNQDVLSYIQGISNLRNIPTADFKAAVGIPSRDDKYGQQHIIYAKSQRNSKNVEARNMVLGNLGEIIKNAHVIEIVPNKKIKSIEGLTGNKRKTQDRKNKVKNFYRIMAPVQIKDRLHTVVIIAEDCGDTVTVEPQNVSLYEIYTNIKKGAPHRSSVRNMAALEAPSTITIREMLSGVKDSDGRFYTGDQLYQTAYHGTPHQFEKFDLGSVGTGEGGAAHGWGIYTAEDRAVATRYRNTLTDGINFTYKKKPVQDLYDQLEKKQDYKKLDVLENFMITQDVGQLTAEDFDPKAWKWFNEKIVPHLKGDGALIKLDVPENNVLLEEDSAIAEQDMGVRDKIVNAYKTLDKEQKATLKKNLAERIKKPEYGEKYNQANEKKKLANEMVSAIKGAGTQRPTVGFKAKLYDKRMAKLRDRGYTDKKLEELKTKGPLFEKEIRMYQDEADKQQAVMDAEVEHTNEEWQKSKEACRRQNVLGIIKHTTGTDFYNALADALGGEQKDASLFLNEHGIKGLTYESNLDGRCYVVFDDNAVSIIERYNQTKASTTKGSIARMANGQRIITLMESADESTFAHEMSHMFFMDLEDLAQIDDVSAKELELVDGWANWEEGSAKEYRNTPWAREFNAYERDIIDAEQNGDHDRAEKLKATWRQERFARAFELYLRDGHAPAKGLKAVFRKFKSFLRTVYLAFTGDGGRASIGVRRVMDRMIATEAEIDEAALDDRYKDVSAAGGGKLLDETDAQTYKRWHDDSVAEAKEKLMKIVMKDLTEEKANQFRQRVETERERMRKQLQQEPVYLAEKAVMASGDEALALNWYESVEAFRQALASNGPLEDVLNTYMDKYQAALDKELQESHLSDEAVREAMEGTRYHEKLEALKATAFAKRSALMNRITTKTERAMQSVEDKLTALPEEVDLKLERRSRPVAEIMKAINRLRFSSKWMPADYRNIENMINASTKAQLQDALKEFKDNTKQSKDNEKAVLEANEGKMKIYAELARKSVLSKPIHEACDYYGHVRNAKAAAKRVQQMIRAERWDMALMAQQQQAMSSAMANESKKMQEHVDAGLQKIKTQLNTRTVRLPKEERYWHRHLAHILRMVATDAREPESGVPELKDIFSSLTESLDMQYAPTDILNIATKGDDFKGYKSLTIGQFDDAVETLTVLYTTGRDKFKMKTIGGKDIADIVDEILNDPGDAAGIHVKDNKIEDSTGGMGYNDAIGAVPLVGKAMALHGQGYLAATMKPEEIIRALGKTAHKYIYGIYEKAAEDEGARMANEYAAMKDMLKGYTHTEKRAWKDKNIKIRTPDGTEMVSKENIICMALNLGNETNIQRLTGGLGIPYSELVPLIESHMLEKDWRLVQNIWDHLDSYWKETVAVEENLNGVALKKQAAVPFVARTANGKEIKMNGGYYPIKYNPKKSSRAEDQDINEAAKRTMSGAVVLGTNRGFTKARTEVDMARPLLLEFSVIPEHLQQVIHNISYRLPARDVYRLVNNSRIEDYISRTIGRDYHKLLKEWATDAWNVVPENSNMAQSRIDRTIGALRRNSVMAIMGYRLWPVVENLSNIGPVMDKLGAAQGLTAVSDFYAHYNECKTLLYKSTFMKNRINSMDRDIKQQPGLFETGPIAFEFMQNHAYDMMLYSDLMLSAPLWVRAYKNAYTGKLEEVRTENERNQQTVLDAQQKVSDIKARAMDIGRNMSDINRHLQVRKVGTPEQIEEEKTSPFAMRPADDLRAESVQNEAELKSMDKDSWQAEQDLNKAMELDILTDDEVLAEAERRSIAEADAAIRDTFGSGEMKDLSSMQRQRNELSKLLTTFYSFFNTQFNAIYANYRHARFGNDGGSKIAQWAPFARSVMYRIVLMSLIGSALKYATGNDGGDDRDKYRKVKDPKTGKEIKEEIPWTERFFKVFAKNLLSTVSGAFVGVRDMANMAINYLFDGTTYGKGFNPISVGFRGGEEVWKAITLMAEMGEKNAKIDAAEEARQQKIDAKLKKLKGKKRQEYLKKLNNSDQYRKPEKKTTYSEILRHGANGAATFTAANTGITNTMIDAVTGTMQYINDSDNRYDPAFKNMVWSALFDKKPVDRDVPEKPPAEPKKKKGNKKKKNN